MRPPCHGALALVCLAVADRADALRELDQMSAWTHPEHISGWLLAGLPRHYVVSLGTTLTTDASPGVPPSIIGTAVRLELSETGRPATSAALLSLRVWQVPTAFAG
jgi:hypothetical protein